MKKIIAILFVLFLSSPAFAGGWYVHDGADHWEGKYSQADAQAMAVAKGWTAVNGKKNIPQVVKDGRDAKEAQAVADKATRIAEIKNKLTSMKPPQLDSYIDANVTDLASVKIYLKRLTLIVRNLAKEQGN